MANRRVTASGKDNQGDITALCNTASWGIVSKANAISHIDNGTHRYYVLYTDNTEVDVVVVNGSTGRYLRTDPDKTTRNNLDDLPNC